MKNQQYSSIPAYSKLSLLKQDLLKQEILKQSVMLAQKTGFLASSPLQGTGVQKLVYANFFQALMVFLVIFSGLALLFTPAYADPPRVLSTSFEDYARQQAQVDKNLSGADRTSRQASSKSSAKPSVATSSPQNASNPNTKSSAKQKNTTPVNINTADEASLSNTLIGVGPSKAKAIIDYRQTNGKFKQPEDLLAVKGIGPATLEKNRARIRVN